MVAGGFLLAIRMEIKKSTLIQILNCETLVLKYLLNLKVDYFYLYFEKILKEDIFNLI